MGSCRKGTTNWTTCSDVTEMTREEDLRLEGWTRMFSATEPRISESVEMYESLGMEVRLEDIETENDEDCNECVSGFEDTIKVIYTRPKRVE